MRRSFPVTDEQKAEIEQYLRNEAVRLIITQDDINRYRERHKHRDKLGYRITTYGKRKIRIPNPHGSYPYCKPCDKRFEIGDSIYSLIVSNYTSWFHVVCVQRMRWKRKRSIVRTDRSQRKKRR